MPYTENNDQTIGSVGATATLATTGGAGVGVFLFLLLFAVKIAVAAAPGGALGFFIGLVLDVRGGETNKTGFPWTRKLMIFGACFSLVCFFVVADPLAMYLR